jgi:starch phosphorylase
MPELGQTVQVGQRIPVSMTVSLDGLTPEDVAVEIVAGRLNSQEEFQDFKPAVAELNGSETGESGIFTYRGEITCTETGRLGVTARVVPKNQYLIHNRKPKLISWW